MSACARRVFFYKQRAMWACESCVSVRWAHKHIWSNGSHTHTQLTALRRWRRSWCTDRIISGRPRARSRGRCESPRLASRAIRTLIVWPRLCHLLFVLRNVSRWGRRACAPIDYVVSTLYVCLCVCALAAPRRAHTTHISSERTFAWSADLYIKYCAPQTHQRGTQHTSSPLPQRIPSCF